MKKNRTLALILFAVISCGGGGSGGSSAPTISESSTPSSTSNPASDPTGPASDSTVSTLSFDELKNQFEGYYEYQSQWGLASINASSAYARGATGEGITIGITDSGLDNNHDEIMIILIIIIC